MANERCETWQQRRARNNAPVETKTSTLDTPAKKTVEPKVITTKVESPKKVEVKKESTTTKVEKD